ncbi:MAG: PAS domain S-box protein [Verrucomicrobia bacterium]|nr:PAS domain S-box protein [Verrucomicrobiota bacterium]
MNNSSQNSETSNDSFTPAADGDNACHFYQTSAERCDTALAFLSKFQDENGGCLFIGNKEFISSLKEHATLISNNNNVNITENSPLCLSPRRLFNSDEQPLGEHIKSTIINSLKHNQLTPPAKTGILADFDGIQQAASGMEAVNTVEDVLEQVAGIEGVTILSQYDMAGVPLLHAQQIIMRHSTVYGLGESRSNSAHIPPHKAAGDNAVTGNIRRLLEWLFRTKQSRPAQSQQQKPGHGLHAQFASLFDNIGAAVFLHDTDGRLIEVNNEASRLLLYDREDLVGMRIIDIDPDANEERTRETLARIGQEGFYSFETKFIRRDGTELDVEINTKFFEWLGRNLLLTTAYNISSKKDIRQTAQNLYESTISKTGLEFFSALTSGLVSVVKADIVIAARIPSEDNRILQTLCTFIDGQPAGDFTFCTEDTPCQEVLRNGFQEYPDHVKDLFPKSRFLQEQNIESYAGVQLRSPSGKVLGVLAILFRRPLENRTPYEDILKIFASRAAAEIERFEIEATINRTNKFFSSIINDSPLGIISLDPQGLVSSWNKSAEKIFGWKGEEVIGKPLPFVDEKHDAEHVLLRKRILNGEHLTGIELERIKKDGSPIFINVYASAIKDEKNQPTGIITIIEDITGKKRAESELHEIEYKLTTLMDNLPGMVYRAKIHHNNWTMVFLSRGCKGLTGYSPEDIIYDKKLAFFDLMHPDDKAYNKHIVMSAVENRQPFDIEYRITTEDGRRKWVLEHGIGQYSKTGEVLYLDGYILDITDRKTAIEELIKSRKDLQSIFKASPIGIGVVHNRIISRVNETLCKTTGYEPRELLDQSARILYPDQDEFERVGTVKYDQINNYGIGAIETKWKRKDGRIIDILLSSAPIDPDNLDKGVTFTAMDITERKQNEEELILHKERFRSLFELSRIEFADEKELLEHALEEIIRLTGSSIGFFNFIRNNRMYPEDCNWSQNVRQFCTAETDKILAIPDAGAWADCARFKRPVMQNNYLNNANRCELPKGHLQLVRHLSVPVIEGNSVIAICSVGNKPTPYDEDDLKETAIMVDSVWKFIKSKREEEERRKLQTQLKHAQQMEVVGQLAGGIAHDFNNLLQIIIGFSEITLDNVPDDDRNLKPLKEILNAAEKAASLTRQLLAFSRRQVIQPKDVDPNNLIMNLLKIIRRTIGEYIDVDFIPGHNIGFIHVDPAQIETAIINLCINARDAMPEGGTITIETENVLINGEYCKSHPWAKAGRYVLISFTDTGIGMDEDTMAQAFEPFFTTKEIGEGTGLGLSSVYGIIKQHEGMIHVYSEPGKGTMFKIYIPLITRRAVEVGKSIPGAIVGGNETILVAEDEKIVRDLAARVLASAGYKVITARDGQEAVNLFKAHAPEIELALLDVIMPKLSGKLVHETIKHLNPETRVIFTSGYSTNAIHTNFIIDDGISLLQKPYASDTLLRQVRSVLDE